MKKYLLVIIVLLLTFFLLACDPAGYYFSKEELQDIISVELIEYQNDKQKNYITWVPDYMDDLKPLIIENIKQLEIMENSKIEEFKEQLCEQYILYHYYAFDSPKGLAIKINYTNGNFTLINNNHLKPSFSGYIGTYNANGEVIDYTGCFASYNSFVNLVNNYFNMQIKEVNY